MYITISFEDNLEIPAVVFDKDFYEKLKASLPITSRTLTWKEEVYFETSIEFKGQTVTRVPSGALAYWPPGKALCLFAWANQPYGPVNHLGWFLGPKHYVFEIDEDEGVNVTLSDPVAYSTKLRALSEQLQSTGLFAAPRKWGEVESVVGAYAKHNIRVGFEVFAEDFGYIIESDPIYERDFSALDEALEYRMRRVVKSRVDTNEDGYVILSEFVYPGQNISDAVQQVVKDYIKVIDILGLIG
ncbi:MAG: cyclophilin-like family protein [Infirmifilum sp.]